jgi:hypothetical protein
MRIFFLYALKKVSEKFMAINKRREGHTSQGKLFLSLGHQGHEEENIQGQVRIGRLWQY